MAERMRKFINGNSTFAWRILIMVLIGMFSWQGVRLVDKVDALETGKADQSQIVDVKTEIKDINTLLQLEIPQIREFIGGVKQYMEDHPHGHGVIKE